MDIPAPPITRAVNEEIMSHLLDTCMRLNLSTLPDQHPIRYALSAMGVEFVEDLYPWTLSDIKEVTWTMPVKSEDSSAIPEVKRLNGGYSNQVYALRNMIADVLDSTNFNTTKEHFLELGRPDYMQYLRNPGEAHKPASLVSTSTAESFTCSVKRDVLAYPKLNNIVDFPSWRVEFDALAIKDGFEDVLNNGYIPNSIEKEQIFRLQNNFLYAVFATTLKATQARNIFHKHTDTHDAQAIYHQVVEEATRSARAHKQKTEHVKNLTMKKLDSSWKGSHDGFLIWFEQELIRYEALVPACEYYKDNQKRAMLEAAVLPQEHLDGVMNQADVVT